MCLVEQRLGGAKLDARHADIEPSAEEIVSISDIQVYFRVDRDAGRQRDPVLLSDEPDRMLEAGRC